MEAIQTDDNIVFIFKRSVTFHRARIIDFKTILFQNLNTFNSYSKHR